MDTGNQVTTLVVLCVRRRPLSGSTHSGQVVLANEDAGEVPELGHVVSLEDLTLVGRSVSVHGESRVLVVLSEVLLRKGDTSSEGNLGSDDTVTTEETGARQAIQSSPRPQEGSLDSRRGEDVHRSTLSLRHTVDATQQLGQNSLDRSTTENGEGVASVRRDDLVVRLDRVVHTDGNGFL